MFEYKSELSPTQQSIKELLEREEFLQLIEGAEKREFDKKTVKTLGSTGVIKNVSKLVYFPEAIPLFAGDGLYGQVSLNAYYRDLIGYSRQSAIRVLDRITFFEQLDENGITRINIDALGLSAHGTFERFKIFDKNTTHVLDQERAISLADGMITAASSDHAMNAN